MEGKDFSSELEETQQWLIEHRRKTRKVSKFLIVLASSAGLTMAVLAAVEYELGAYGWMTFDLVLTGINIDTIRRQLKVLKTLR